MISKLRKASTLGLRCLSVTAFAKLELETRVTREPEVKYGDLVNTF